MASGTISSSTGTYLNLHIKWTSTANSISVSAYASHYSYSGSAPASGTLTVGGQSTSMYIPLTTCNNTYHETSAILGQSTFSVSGSSVTISASWPCAITYSGKYLGTITCSGTATLESGGSSGGETTTTPTITPTYSLSATEVNIGGTITLNASVSGSSSACNVKFYISGYNISDVGESNACYESANISAAPYAFTIPNYWGKGMRNSTEANAICEVTPNGGTKQTLYFKVKVPTTTVPSIGSFQAILNSGGLNGSYVQGRSKATLTMSNVAAGDSYSTITSYSISGPQLSVSKESGTTGIILSFGTLTYAATVTDSRGRSATKTCNIDVLAYAPPIVYITATRSLTSDQININYTASCSTLNNQNKLNKIIIYYKKKSDSSFTKLKEITLNAYSASSTTTASNCDPMVEYIFYAEATDTAYGAKSKSLEVTASTESRPINIGCNKGVGIGKLSTVTNNSGNGLFEVGWDTKIDQNLTVAGTITTESISITGLPASLTNDDGNGGYQQLPSGLIIQWGVAYVAANTEYATVTFPKQFTQFAFSLSCQNVWNHGRNIGISTASFDIFGFKAYPYITGTNEIPTVETKFYWIAIGV